MLYRKSTISFFQSQGITVVAYKPLQRGGALSNPKIQAIAAAHGKSPSQVCIRWGVQKGLVVLAKTANASRMTENIQVFDFTLTDDEMAALDSLTTEDKLVEWRSHLAERCADTKDVTATVNGITYVPF